MRHEPCRHRLWIGRQPKLDHRIEVEEGAFCSSQPERSDGWRRSKGRRNAQTDAASCGRTVASCPVPAPAIPVGPASRALRTPHVVTEKYGYLRGSLTLPASLRSPFPIRTLNAQHQSPRFVVRSSKVHRSRSNLTALVPVIRMFFWAVCELAPTLGVRKLDNYPDKH